MADTTYHLSMTTCPRENPTIVAALTSLRDSGYKGALNISEDDNQQLGCFRNHHKALTESIASGADVVGVIPDDMLFTNNWQYIVEGKIKENNLGSIALYVPKGLGNRYSFKRGWNTCNKGWAGAWGGCYLFPLKVAKEVVSHPFYLSHLNNELPNTDKLLNYEWNKRVDHCIPEVLFQLGYDQWYYAPSVCEHVGFNSTIGHRYNDADRPYLR